MNSICLFTVIYPGCEPFLKHFFSSVENQTFEAFDLVILNDGFKKVKKFITVDNNRVEIIPVNGTIAKIREYGLKILINSKYSKVVFADADDYFSTSRIEMANKALDEMDIYVNDVSIIDSNEVLKEKKYFSKRLSNNYKISKEFILQKNILGLGNTSVRRSALRNVLVPDSTIAVDWLVFTDMLLRGCTARFMNNSTTFYRQHESNTVGFKNLTQKRLQKALKVQVQNASYFAEFSEIHQNHLEKLRKLKRYLSGGQLIRKKYLNELKKILPECPFWWEEIKTLDQITT